MILFFRKFINYNSFFYGDWVINQKLQKNTEDKPEPPELKKLTKKNITNNLTSALVTFTSNSVFPGSSPVNFLVISRFLYPQILVSKLYLYFSSTTVWKSDFFFKLLNTPFWLIDESGYFHLTFLLYYEIVSRRRPVISTEPNPSVLLRTNISFSLSPS